MSSKMLERINIELAATITDTNGSAITGDYVSLTQHDRCLILCIMGDGTAGDANDLDLLIYQATDVAGGSAKVLNALETGRIYTKYGADFTAVAALTGWTKVTQATADEQYCPTDSGESVGMIALEIEAADLDTDNGFCCIRCDTSNPGAAKYAAIVYIMGDPKYPADPTLMKTALTA